MDDFHFISPSPIICCIAGLTPDNNSVTSSIDNQCNVYGKTDLWKRVRSPFRKLFTSISFGNIIGVSSFLKRTRLMKQRQTILAVVILRVLSIQVLVLVILALFPYAPDPGLSILNNNIYTFLAPLSTVLLLVL